MDALARLTELAKLPPAERPVVSVYLNTRWTDEHQRERTRLFLKGELHRAREAHPGKGWADALDWIESEGEALIGQARDADAHGVAFFVGPALGLREVIPVRAPASPRRRRE